LVSSILEKSSKALDLKRGTPQAFLDFLVPGLNKGHFAPWEKGKIPELKFQLHFFYYWTNKLLNKL